MSERAVFARGMGKTGHPLDEGDFAEHVIVVLAVTRAFAHPRQLQVGLVQGKFVVEVRTDVLHVGNLETLK